MTSSFVMEMTLVMEWEPVLCMVGILVDSACLARKQYLLAPPNQFILTVMMALCAMEMIYVMEVDFVLFMEENHVLPPALAMNYLDNVKIVETVPWCTCNLFITQTNF